MDYEDSPCFTALEETVIPPGKMERHDDTKGHPQVFTTTFRFLGNTIFSTVYSDQQKGFVGIGDIDSFSTKVPNVDTLMKWAEYATGKEVPIRKESVPRDVIPGVKLRNGERSPGVFMPVFFYDSFEFRRILESISEQRHSMVGRCIAHVTEECHDLDSRTPTDRDFDFIEEYLRHMGGERLPLPGLDMVPVNNIHIGKSAVWEWMFPEPVTFICTLGEDREAGTSRQFITWETRGNFISPETLLHLARRYRVKYDRHIVGDSDGTRWLHPADTLQTTLVQLYDRLGSKEVAILVKEGCATEDLRLLMDALPNLSLLLKAIPVVLHTVCRPSTTA